MPWLSAHEKLLTAFAGESLPDVSPIGNTWIPEFAARGRGNAGRRDRRVPGLDVPDYFPAYGISGVVDGGGFGRAVSTWKRALARSIVPIC